MLATLKGVLWVEAVPVGCHVKDPGFNPNTTEENKKDKTCIEASDCICISQLACDTECLFMHLVFNY
jgi:hypothetical protein